jgi:hypothetical protein
MDNDVLSWVNRNIRNWPLLPVYILVFLVFIYILSNDPLSPNHEWIHRSNEIILAYSAVYIKYAEYLVFTFFPLSIIFLSLSKIIDGNSYLDFDKTFGHLSFRLFVFSTVIGCISLGLLLFGQKNNQKFPTIDNITYGLFILMTISYIAIMIIRIHNILNTKR